MQAETGLGVVGGKCRVTSGPNKGKEGTYTVDEDGKTWCEDGWGGTECTGGKCEDAARATHVRDYLDANGKQVYETDGLYQIDGNRIVRFRATVDAMTGSASNVAAVPVDVVSLADLRSSKSNVDQLFAEALQGHLDKIGRAQH